MPSLHIANIWVNILNITKFRNDGIPEFQEVFDCGLIMFTVLISCIYRTFRWCRCVPNSRTQNETWISHHACIACSWLSERRHKSGCRNRNINWHVNIACTYGRASLKAPLNSCPTLTNCPWHGWHIITNFVVVRLENRSEFTVRDRVMQPKLILDNKSEIIMFQENHAISSTTNVNNMATLQDLIIQQMDTADQNTSEISDEPNIEVSKLARTLSARRSINKCWTPTVRRWHLELSDKLKVILLSESGELRKEIWEEFQIAPRKYRRMLNYKVQLRQQALDSWPLTIKRKFFCWSMKMVLDNNGIV